MFGLTSGADSANVGNVARTASNAHASTTSGVIGQARFHLSDEVHAASFDERPRARVHVCLCAVVPRAPGTCIRGSCIGILYYNVQMYSVFCILYSVFLYFCISI